MSLTSIRGSRDSNGSWKIICISRRRGFSSREDRCVTSLSLYTILPAVGSMSRSSNLPVVVLPLPLSPTRPRISPFLTNRFIPSTALTDKMYLEKTVERKPCLTGKCFFNPSADIITCFYKTHNNIFERSLLSRGNRQRYIIQISAFGDE